MSITSNVCTRLQVLGVRLLAANDRECVTHSWSRSHREVHSFFFFCSCVSAPCFLPKVNKSNSSDRQSISNTLRYEMLRSLALTAGDDVRCVRCVCVCVCMRVCIKRNKIKSHIFCTVPLLVVILSMELCTIHFAWRVWKKNFRCRCVCVLLIARLYLVLFVFVICVSLCMRVTVFVCVCASASACL